jgi:hypothetical protein
MKETNSKLTRYQKWNGKNTRENFGMSKVAKVKKEQRGEEKQRDRRQQRHNNNRRAKRGTSTCKKPEKLWIR